MRMFYQNLYDDIKKLKKELSLIKRTIQDENVLKSLAKCERIVEHLNRTIGDERDGEEISSSWDPGKSLTIDEAYYYYK